MSTITVTEQRFHELVARTKARQESSGGVREVITTGWFVMLATPSGAPLLPVMDKDDPTGRRVKLFGDHREAASYVLNHCEGDEAFGSTIHRLEMAVEVGA